MKSIRKEEYMKLLKEGKKNIVTRSKHKFFLMEDETLLDIKHKNKK